MICYFYSWKKNPIAWKSSIEYLSVTSMDSFDEYKDILAFLLLSSISLFDNVFQIFRVAGYTLTAWFL